MTMKKLLAMCWILLVGCAMGQANPPRDVTLNADSSADDVLDALDARGKQLTDFIASVKLSESDAATGSGSTRSGKLWLQRKSPTDARVRVTFLKKSSGEKMLDEKLDYLLDKGWLIEQDFHKFNQVSRQVLRPGQK